MTKSPSTRNKPLTVTGKTDSVAPSRALAALEALSTSYSFQKIEQLVNEGASAIWGGMSWEAPLLYACDTIPVSIGELWREESYEAEAVGENHFQVPAEYCSMIKAMIGRLHLRRDEKIKRILYFGSTCEPISNVLELAKSDGYDTYCIENVTAFTAEDKRPEVVRFLADELQKVAIWLTGRPVDEERLKFEIRRKNTVSRKINRILELRLKSPFYLTSIPTLQVLMGTNHNFGNPEEFVRVLDLLIEELEFAAQTPETRSYIPLVLAGGAAGGGGILKVIEESNAAILGWVIAGTELYPEDIPPLEAMAHYVLDAQSRGELGEGAGTSATYRRFHIERLFRSTGARGIIASAITGCPYGSVVQQTERDYFKEQGIPIISLESSVHKERPTEEQVMRVKTFVEMLS
jgi:benzoyl-CoA reductase/2-hydroxyglutaryl-CoA dehydratase subunit BcrC/BadD/HgdB